MRTNEKHGTTCVRKMENLNHTCQQGGKVACVSCAVQKNTTTSLGFARCFALGSFLLLRPWSLPVKRPVSLLPPAGPQPKNRSVAIHFDRIVISQHMPWYLPLRPHRPRQRTCPPRQVFCFPPIARLLPMPPQRENVCQNTANVFATQGISRDFLAGRRFGGPAGAPCSPVPRGLDAHPSHPRSPRNGTPPPDREMHRLRVTRPPAYLPPLPRSAVLSMTKLTAPSRNKKCRGGKKAKTHGRDQLNGL